MISIDDLKISKRLYWSLSKNGVRFLEDVEYIDEDILLRFVNFGQKCLDEINEVCKKKDVYLGVFYDGLLWKQSRPSEYSMTYKKWVISYLQKVREQKRSQTTKIPNNNYSTFEIDKNIEIPNLKREKRSKSKDTLCALEVGDSFFMMDEQIGSVRKGAIYKYAKVIGIKVSVRRLENGLRVWRIG